MSTITVGELVDEGAGSLQTGPFGTQLKAAEYVGAGRPLLNVRNVGFGDVRSAGLDFVSDKTARRLHAHVLEEEDIVFGRKGAVERHAFIPAAFAGSVQGSDCIRLRLNRERVLPRFVSFALRTEAHRAWMQNQCSHGATMASLNQDIVRRIEIPALSLPVQAGVVAVLGALDDLIENNRRRIALLEQMAQAIYREWFVHRAGPDGWAPRQISEVATIVRGRSYRKQELVEQGGVPFINLKCLERGGGFRRDGLKRYDGSFKPAQQTRSGDIVMAVTDLTQSREILARSTLVPRLTESFGVISLDVVRVVPMHEADRLPLFLVLRHSDLSERVKEFANGSTVLHLSPEHISAAVIPWPSDAAREEIAEVTGKAFGLIDELADAADRLASLRDLLLPKLVTGAVDVSHLDLEAFLEDTAA